MKLGDTVTFRYRQSRTKKEATGEVVYLGPKFRAKRNDFSYRGDGMEFRRRDQWKVPHDGWLSEDDREEFMCAALHEIHFRDSRGSVVKVPRGNGEVHWFSPTKKQLA